MVRQDSHPDARPPVFLGCAVMLGLLLVLVAGGAFAVAFLESGANDGRVQLRDARSYAPNSVEFVSSQNVFLVRTRDGTYFALSNLDAANRATPGRQCRVGVVPATDPEFPDLMDEYGGQFSEHALGSSFLLREDCNGALYDPTGLRLNAEDSPNLDRFEVRVADNGRLELNMARRQCTQRAGDQLFAETECA